MKIPFCVICAHLFLIGTTLFFHSAPQKIVKRSPIAVKTYLTPTAQASKVIQATPPAQPTIAQIVPPPQSTSSQATTPPTPIKEITTPPKTPAKAPPSLSTKPTKTSTTTKTEGKTKVQDKAKTEGKANASHDQLITLMQKSLQTLNGSGTKAETQPTPVLGALASEALRFENRYEEELISFLESCLSFPEKGEENEKVKLKLTLKRDGSVQKVEILQAHSEKNRYYCESTLNSLSFPPFGTYFKGKNQKIFTITLTTEHRSH